MRRGFLIPWPSRTPASLELSPSCPPRPRQLQALSQFISAYLAANPGCLGSQRTISHWHRRTSPRGGRSGRAAHIPHPCPARAEWSVARYPPGPARQARRPRPLWESEVYSRRRGVLRLTILVNGRKKSARLSGIAARMAASISTVTPDSPRSSRPTYVLWTPALFASASCEVMPAPVRS